MTIAEQLDNLTEAESLDGAILAAAALLHAAKQDSEQAGAWAALYDAGASDSEFGERILSDPHVLGRVMWAARMYGQMASAPDAPPH